ncbi:MAG: cache domain-containing protein [Candidatus Omnitrophota bacterium]
MKKLVVLFVAIAMFAVLNAFAADINVIMPVLDSAKQSIDSTLSGIDKDLKAAAKELSSTDLKGAAARKILNNLIKYRPYVIDCSIIDANGIKITVEPAEYKQFEGADRSGLQSVTSLLKEKIPVMSDVYHSAEGIHAISIGYPIFSDKGDLLGAVRMLIRHEVFLKPLVEDQPCKIWVMQKNGLIVYDSDPEEIGKNIFFDSMFKPFEALIAFSMTVAAAHDGAGSYNFYADRPKDNTFVQKIAAWDTAGLYGTEWRVIAMEVGKTLTQPPAPEAEKGKTATEAPPVAQKAPAK